MLRVPHTNDDIDPLPSTHQLGKSQRQLAEEAAKANPDNKLTNLHDNIFVDMLGRMLNLPPKPTTPRTSSEPLATSSMNAVSASVGAACTRIVPSMAAAAVKLGVGERTLQRAVRWLEEHDRAAASLLRPRTHGGGAKAVAVRWAKRAAAKAEKPGS